MKAIKVEGCQNCPKHRCGLYCQALERRLEDMITSYNAIHPSCSLPDWPEVNEEKMKLLVLMLYGSARIGRLEIEFPEMLEKIGVIIWEEEKDGHRKV